MGQISSAEELLDRAQELVDSKIKCGDLVKLKSGGPVMTVGSHIGPRPDGVECHWFESQSASDGSRPPRSAVYPIGCLAPTQPRATGTVPYYTVVAGHLLGRLSEWLYDAHKNGQRFDCVNRPIGGGGREITITLKDEEQAPEHPQ